jgi:hypothetical protein
MKLVETQFMTNPGDEEQTGGEAQAKPKNINQRVRKMLSLASETDQ